MSRIVRMLRKDLRRSLRAPVWIITMTIFPLAFAGMLGLAFGRPSTRTGLPRVKVLLADLDEGFLAQLITGGTNNGELAEMFEFIEVPTAEEGRRRMGDGEASGLIVIPDGFTEDLIDRRIPATLTVVKNPSESILPQIAEEFARVDAVYLDQGVRIFGDPLKTIGDSFIGVDDDPGRFPVDPLLTTLTLALAAKVRPALHYLSPPAIIYATVDETAIPLRAVLEAPAGETLAGLKAKAGEARSAGPAGAAPGAAAGARADASRAGPVPAAGAAAPAPPARQGFNIFAMLLPMVSVLSVLFLGEAGMRDLLAEQQAGTLKRQFISPASVAEVIGAKALFTLAVTAGALIVLGVVGLLLGWIPRTISLPGSAVQLAAIACASTGLAALVYGMVRSERAARSTYSAVAMGMSFVGGSFVPSSELPEALKTLGLFTINHWGIQGMTDLTMRGGGAREVLPEAGALLIFALAGMTIGWLRLSRRFAAGRAA